VVNTVKEKYCVFSVVPMQQHEGSNSMRSEVIYLGTRQRLCDLPSKISSETIGTFHTRLKTHLFLVIAS